MFQYTIYQISIRKWTCFCIILRYMLNDFSAFHYILFLLVYTFSRVLLLYTLTRDHDVFNKELQYLQLPFFLLISRSDKLHGPPVWASSGHPTTVTHTLPLPYNQQRKQAHILQGRNASYGNGNSQQSRTNTRLRCVKQV